MKYLFYLVVFGLAITDLAAQCCSGGVPMAGNIGMPVGEAKSFQLSATVDYNGLQTYLTGSQKAIEQPARERNTTTLLIEGSYAFSKLFSVDILIPHVTQQRIVGLSELSISGIGDPVILPKITLFEKLTIGAGVKIPLGSSEKTDKGLATLIDLQPGSGAWDQIYHLSYTVRQLQFLKTMSSFATLNVRKTGTNNDYLFNNTTYRIGSEIQVLVGVSNRFIVLKQHLIDMSLKFRFRHAAKDESNGTTPLSSGGQWVFVNPGISYLISRKVSFQTNLELPLYNHVEGTQLSPTFRINSGFFLTFNNN